METIKCQKCGHVFDLNPGVKICPFCGSSLRFESRREMDPIRWRRTKRSQTALIALAAAVILGYFAFVGTVIVVRGCPSQWIKNDSGEFLIYGNTQVVPHILDRVWVSTYCRLAPLDQ